MTILEMAVLFLLFSWRAVWIQREPGYLFARSRCSSR